MQQQNPILFVLKKKDVKVCTYFPPCPSNSIAFSSSNAKAHITKKAIANKAHAVPTAFSGPISDEPRPIDSASGKQKGEERVCVSLLSLACENI